MNTNTEGFESYEDLKSFKQERDTQTNITEESKTYIWSRVFLSNEDDTLSKGDKVYLKHKPTDEVLETMFISYNKGTSKTDSEDEDDVQNYSKEEDKKVLCLAVDLNYINRRENDIPYIKTLFRESYFYEYDMLKMSEWEIYSEDEKFDFYSISLQG